MKVPAFGSHVARPTIEGQVTYASGRQLQGFPNVLTMPQPCAMAKWPAKGSKRLSPLHWDATGQDDVQLTAANNTWRQALFPVLSFDVQRCASDH